MLSVVFFGSVLPAHLGLSGFLLWRFLDRTSHYSAVPSSEAYTRSHWLAESAKIEGLSLTASDFLVLGSTTHQTWTPRPWTLLFALGGLLLWLAAVVLQSCFAPPWLT